MQTGQASNIYLCRIKVAKKLKPLNQKLPFETTKGSFWLRVESRKEFLRDMVCVFDQLFDGRI